MEIKKIYQIPIRMTTNDPTHGYEKTGTNKIVRIVKEDDNTRNRSVITITNNDDAIGENITKINNDD